MKSLVSNLIVPMFMFCVRCNFPCFAALALSLLTKKINKKGNHTILCLGRSIFLDDVKALAKYSGEHKYIYFQRGLLGKIVRNFITSDKLHENNYYTEQIFKKGREDAKQFMRKMFPVLQRVLQFDCVMSCNIGYIDQQEFFIVAKENNIPGVILYKEGLGIIQYLEDLVKIYTNHVFQGDLLLCYNNHIKKSLSTASITGLSPKKIKVTGIPRLDSYIHEKKENYKQLTLFSFSPNKKLFYFTQDKQTRIEIERLSEQFHYMIMKYAYEHPEWKVIVKTKAADRYLSYVRNIHKKYFFDMEIANLTITNSADSKKLILESPIIFGLNSTVFFEAVLAGKKIVSPDLRKLFKNGVVWDYFSDCPDLVNYVATYEELVVTIEENVSQVVNREDKDKFLVNYIHAYDGQSGRRVEDAISQLVG